MRETLLYTFKPILDFIPEVTDANGRIPLKDRILWTSFTLFIYLICCQIPLFGIYKTSDADPLYWMRVILASNKGTLMELGISPLLTSNMIIELISNAKLITYNPQIKQDKRLLEAFEKLLSIIVSLGTAFVYVFAGMYGQVQYIGVLKALLLVLQLTFASVIVIYLDEMIQKGYGIGSGTSLFIATNICENFFWKSFSPVTIATDNGVEFEGAVIALFHFLLTKENKVTALKLALYRGHLTNLYNIFTTVLIFLIVIYFQGFQIDLRLINKQYKGASSSFPIKLFYLSNTPIILQSALISNLHVISNILFKKFKQFSFIRILGVWKMSSASGREELIGGIAYYLVPPASLSDVVKNPFHFVVYLIIVTVTCGVFSKLWLELSGKSSVDVLRNFHENNMTVAGVSRELSIYKYLNKYIPIAAILGGVFISLLSVFSDLIGIIGSGTGVLLVVNIIYGFYETIKKESDGNGKQFSLIEF